MSSGGYYSPTGIDKEKDALVNFIRGGICLICGAATVITFIMNATFLTNLSGGNANASIDPDQHNFALSNSNSEIVLKSNYDNEPFPYEMSRTNNLAETQIPPAGEDISFLNSFDVPMSSPFTLGPN